MRKASRRRSLFVMLTALLVSPAASSRLGAQDITELERRVDTLAARHAEAAAALLAYRHRPVKARVYTDTVALLGGTVRIVTDAEFLPLARAAAARAEPFIRERAGSAYTKSAGTVFAIWTDSLHRAQKGVVMSASGDGQGSGSGSVFATTDAVSQFIEAKLQSTIFDAKPRFAAWFNGPLPIGPATGDEWRAIRLELVSSPTTVSRRCFDGVLLACREALGLTPQQDPATAWFDSTGRRALMEEVRRGTSVDERVLAACRAGSDAECIELLRTNPAFATWLAPPATGRARDALVQEAIAAGGAGALARAANVDGPDAVLSAISGLPMDSLLARWQKRAHDGGAQSDSATPIIALTAAGWFLVMGALSSRSSRWR